MDDNTTELWDLYQKGVDHHNAISLYSTTEKAYNFYEDRQWVGVEAGGEALPFYNIIKPIVKYKTASIAMNDMAIVMSPMDRQEGFQEVCDHLNGYAKTQWEKLKMESVNWDVVKAAQIAGDAYLYFYDKGNKCQAIDNTNVYLSDEQSADIQKQSYIIISERLQVSDVREIAKENGIDDIDLIVADEAEHQTNKKDEVKAGKGKCTSLLKMWKENGVVHFCKAVKQVVYQPDTPIEGLTYYPLANLVIEQLHNSSRGQGEVKPRIANQIEINKTLYRRSEAVKQAAFPQLVYDEMKLENPEMIGVAGQALAMSGGVSNVRDVITYLQAQPISSDAKLLCDELMQVTKDLAGAGDAALGQVDPERASGDAIIAVRDQASIPLNESISAYKQYVEDVANIWYSMWVAYNPEGMDVKYTDEEGQEVQGHVDGETLTEMQVNVRIDVSPNNPFSKYAQEKSLDNLFQNQQLSFEEYINALDDNSSVPKNKMLAIIERRKVQEESEKDMALQQLQQENQKLNSYINQIAQQLGYPQQGGQENAMQQVQQ